MRCGPGVSMFAPTIAVGEPNPAAPAPAFPWLVLLAGLLIGVALNDNDDRRGNR